MINSNRFYSIYLPLLLIFVASIIRFFFIFKWHLADNYIFSDMSFYVGNADKIFKGSINIDNFFQPIGYPLVISLILKISHGNLSAMYFAHFFMSVATLFFIWKTTEKLTNKYLAILALFFASFHFPLIYYSGVYLSEILFMFVLSFIFWLIVNKLQYKNGFWCYIIGGMIGISFWIKGTFSLYIPIYFLWIVSINFRKISKLYFWALKPTVFILCGALTMMIIHGVFSYKTIDHFLLINTNGGFNFMVGKCPWKKNIQADGAIQWHSPLDFQLGNSESRSWNEPFNNSLYYYKEGLDCIAKNPSILIHNFSYFAYLFINNDLWPIVDTKHEYKTFSRDYDLFYAFWLIPALFFGSLYLLKNPDDQKIIVWLLPLLTLLLIAWTFLSEVRFRVPFDVILIPMGVWGWDLILASIFSNWNAFRRYKMQAYIYLFVAIIVISALVKIG